MKDSNKNWQGGKVSSTTPGTTVPSGGRQSSGEVIHNRAGGMNIAGKGENLNDMPSCKKGGSSKGSVAGVA
jgi:hypothetical protein